jgi:ubiquinone/menaquinone biosynthesis C-methylase UbiE
MSRLVQAFFRLLYTRLAGIYDYVAATVSLGEWRLWGEQVLPLLTGRTLELGHGPGHLHARVRRGDPYAVAIDAARPMTRLAAARLHTAGLSNSVACASALQLPFGDAVFDRVFATFPAPYIFDPETLAGVHRVLRPDGLLLIVPGATLTGRGPLVWVIKLVYVVTGQRHAADGEAERRVAERLQAHGFALEARTTPTPQAKVTVWVCRKIARA